MPKWPRIPQQLYSSSCLPKFLVSLRTSNRGEPALWKLSGTSPANPVDNFISEHSSGQRRKNERWHRRPDSPLKPSAAGGGTAAKIAATFGGGKTNPRREPLEKGETFEPEALLHRLEAQPRRSFRAIQNQYESISGKCLHVNCNFLGGPCS